MRIILTVLLIAISFEAHAERLLTLDIDDESYSIYDDWNDIHCGIKRDCFRNHINPFSKYFGNHTEQEVEKHLSTKMIFAGSAYCQELFWDIFPTEDSMWVHSTKTGTARIRVEVADDVVQAFVDDATAMHEGCPRSHSYMFILFGEAFENDWEAWRSNPKDRLDIFIERIEMVPCGFNRELRQVKWLTDIGSYAFVAGRLAKLGIAGGIGGQLLNTDEFCSD